VIGLFFPGSRIQDDSMEKIERDGKGEAKSYLCKVSPTLLVRETRREYSEYFQ